MLLSDFHPATQLRFCPFCGAQSFLWNGRNAHQCQACQRKMYTNTAAATVAIIVNPAGQLLLVRRKFDPAKGMLDLPGGFVDIGESAEAAMVREVKEELNLEVQSLRFWKSFPNEYLYASFLYFTTDLVFVCEVADFSPLQASDDAEEYMFLYPHQIAIDEVGLKSIKEVLRQYIAQSL